MPNLNVTLFASFWYASLQIEFSKSLSSIQPVAKSISTCWARIRYHSWFEFFTNVSWLLWRNEFTWDFSSLSSLAIWRHFNPSEGFNKAEIALSKPHPPLIYSLKRFYICPPTPLNFSTKAAIFWKTVCFWVLYCGFKGLSLGSASLRAVPFSEAYSRLSDDAI